MKKEVRVLAPAKVNLDLFILGRRADGFHELSTTMLLVGLHDELVIGTREEPGVACTLTGPALSSDVPSGPSNLAVAALERGLAALKQEGHPVPGIELGLTKHIPSGAGLGGGSSDGAAALHGLQQLLDTWLDPSVAESILADLGSDCVFFGAARETGLGICRGRGEQVQALPGPRGWWLVLLTPDLQASTQAVFSALQAPPIPDAPGPQDSIAWATKSLAQVRALQCNDLEAPALIAVPSLGPWREVLPPDFVLSGSGSSFYRLCRDESEAQTVADQVAESLGGASLCPRLLIPLPLALDCPVR